MKNESLTALENYKKIKEMIEPFKIRQEFEIDSKSKYKKIRKIKKFYSSSFSITIFFPSILILRLSFGTNGNALSHVH